MVMRIKYWQNDGPNREEILITDFRVQFRMSMYVASYMIVWGIEIIHPLDLRSAYPSSSPWAVRISTGSSNP